MSGLNGNDGKYQPRPGHIPGVVVNFAGNNLVLAPLGLGAVREFDKRHKEAGDDRDATMEIGIDMILASLRRNYPEMEREQLIALLDQLNIAEASKAITQQSGMERITPGELAAREAQSTTS